MEKKLSVETLPEVKIVEKLFQNCKIMKLLLNVMQTFAQQCLSLYIIENYGTHFT